MSLLLTTLRQLPANVWVLAVTFSLVMTGVALLLFIGGLVGEALAPRATLATLPIAAFVVGSALMAIPAALLLQRFSRKRGTYIGLAASFAGAVSGAYAVNAELFGALVLCGFFLGVAMPFYQQFRFAVLESLPHPELAGPALSVLMLFNIGGAILGPELGSIGRNWLAGVAPFTGSFVLFAACIVLAMLVFTQFRNPLEQACATTAPARPLREIVRQPLFVVALIAGALGFAVMSFLMTSTPLSMHSHHGHSLADAKWVIQSHLIAMFLPSLFSGFLLQRLGVYPVMFAGGVLYLLVAMIALAGHGVGHYWWALVLLGVGWNFLFLTGTSLLPQTYNPAERFKTQAVNDFAIFSLQAVASLSAAWVLFRFGWFVQVASTLPLVLLVLAAAGYGSRYGSKAQ